jgi:hypothetical protein
LIFPTRCRLRHRRRGIYVVNLTLDRRLFVLFIRGFLFVTKTKARRQGERREREREKGRKR